MARDNNSFSSVNIQGFIWIFMKSISVWTSRDATKFLAAVLLYVQKYKKYDHTEIQFSLIITNPHLLHTIKLTYYVGHCGNKFLEPYMPSVRILQESARYQEGPKYGFLPQPSSFHVRRRKIEPLSEEVLPGLLWAITTQYCFSINPKVGVKTRRLALEEVFDSFWALVSRFWHSVVLRIVAILVRLGYCNIPYIK